MQITKTDLFEDIAIAMEWWVTEVSSALTVSNAPIDWVEAQEPYKRLQSVLAGSSTSREDVQSVFRESLLGFAVSFLTVLDGGTASAEKGRMYLVDAAGQHLGEGLHDDFVSYLMESGRLE